MKEKKISALFLDIGGVLLTDGWNRHSRQTAIENFGLDKTETDDRHGLVFATYELGKLTLDDYLKHVVFFKERKFSVNEFKAFMFQQSQPLEGAIEYFKELKQQYGYKVVAVSNEPRELNAYRIEKYQLTKLFDFFVSSCYVSLRKPDPDIFKYACDIGQVLPSEALFIDDRLMYTEMAVSLGISSLHYQGLHSAKNYFRANNTTVKIE